MKKEECHFNKEGYLEFSYGYIGHVDGEPFWHGELEELKKKAKPIINYELMKDAYELKKSLETK